MELPFYLTIGPLVGAVAAGNTVALKPSELAPACSALMAKLLPQYLDPHAVVVVEGDGYVTQELLAQGFDKAMFTGGTEIGKRILEGAARTSRRWRWSSVASHRSTWLPTPTLRWRPVVSDT